MIPISTSSSAVGTSASVPYPARQAPARHHIRRSATMSDRLQFLRERLADVLAPLTATVPSSGLRMGEWMIVSEARDVAMQLAGTVADTPDAQLDTRLDTAVASIIGMCVGRDGAAAMMCGDPLRSLSISHVGEGAARVLLALLEMYADLERPIPASALMQSVRRRRPDACRPARRGRSGLRGVPAVALIAPTQRAVAQLG